MYSRTFFSLIRPIALTTGALLFLSNVASARRIWKGPGTVDPPPGHIIPPIGSTPVLLTPLGDLVNQQPHLPVATQGDVDGIPQVATLWGQPYRNIPVTETVNVTELSAIGANADALWPGSLVQGTNLLKGALSPVNVARAPGTLSLTPAGGQPRSIDVPVPGANSVGNARLGLLGQGTFAPAPLSVEYHRFYSLNNAMFKVGGRSSFILSDDVRNQLDANIHAHPNHLLVVFRQPFYTLSLTPPTTPYSYFANSVTDVDFRPYTAPNNSNPTLYIPSVTYGRMGLLFFSSDQSYDNLKQSVQAVFNARGMGSLVHAGARELEQHSDIKLVMLYRNPDVAVNFANGAAAVGKMMDWQLQPVKPSDLGSGIPSTTM